MGTSVKPLTSGEDAESEVIYTMTDDKGKEIREKTTKLMIPYDGTGIASSIEAANDLADFNDRFDKLGSGKKQSQSQMTPDEWGKKWSKLKPGESLIGLDGKKYIKK
jgi:hypothetical protein